MMKRWYTNIEDLRAKHKLVVLMQYNAGEYESDEIMQFLELKKTEFISAHQKNNCRMKRQNQRSTLS